VRFFICLKEGDKLDMRKTLLALSLISIAGLIGIGSFANQINSDKPHKMGDHQCHIQKMKKELSLTDTQVEQVKTIFGDKETHKTEWTNLKTKRQELVQLISSPNASQEEALRKSDEIARTRAEMSQRHIQHVYAIKAILTPEQLKKFNGKLAQKEAKMMKKHHHMPI
jgi:Spy/CpxP family protein refolding chaperone